MVGGEGNSRVSIGASWISGSVSGVAASALLQPFDTIRTQMQKSEKGANLTTRQAFRRVIDKDGWLALWRGITPTIARVGFGTGMYFSLLNSISSAWSNPAGSGKQEERLSGPKAFAAGFTARTVASVTLLPLTVVKTRFEAGQNQHGGTLRTLAWIAREEGVHGLCRGLVPTVLRDAPFSGMYYVSYTRLKAFLRDEERLDAIPSQAKNFGAGIVAGALASLMTNPFDVVRTRLQLAPEMQKGSMTLAVSIAEKEGWRALWLRGLGPRVYKKSLAAAISWTVYEEGVKALAGVFPAKNGSPASTLPAHTMLPIEGGGGGGQGADLVDRQVLKRLSGRRPEGG